MSNSGMPESLPSARLPALSILRLVDSVVVTEQPFLLIVGLLSEYEW